MFVIYSFIHLAVFFEQSLYAQPHARSWEYSCDQNKKDPFSYTDTKNLHYIVERLKQ